MSRDVKFPEIDLNGLKTKKDWLKKQFNKTRMEKQFEKHMDKHLKSLRKHDVGAAAAFLGALTVMLFVATYVISRLAADHARRNKWFDYDDCGWG